MSVAGSDSPSFESLLREADAMRSADRQAFTALPGKLDAEMAQATPWQRRQLRYLHTCRMARAGDFGGAIAELKRLFDEVDDVPLKSAPAPFWPAISRRPASFQRA